MNMWKQIDMLEDEQKWIDAREATLAIWRQNSSDNFATIRLGFLCWFVLVEWACIDTTKLNDKDYNEFQTLLSKVTNSGIQNLKNDPDFLWIFGYMISLFPYYFGEYEEWENKGMKMIENAHFLRPNDPIIEMIFLNGEPESNYKDACRRAKPLVKERFSGDGIMNGYLSEVLNRNE